MRLTALFLRLLPTAVLLDLHWPARVGHVAFQDVSLVRFVLDTRHHALLVSSDRMVLAPTGTLA